MVSPPAFPRYDQTYRIDRLHLIETLTPQLEQEPSLAFAYLYGSATDQQTVHDVDIGLYYQATDSIPTSDRMLTLANQLSSALHIPVDIRILNHEPLAFVFHVLQGQLLTDQHPDLHATILEQTGRDYLDIAPLLWQSTKDAFIFMALNADIIRSRCGVIEESLVRLEQLQHLTKDQFLSNQDTLDIACYRLLITIEAALALCFHVSAKRLKKTPEEYAGCFSLLHEADIIPADLCDRLQKMARFRNLLIHVYWKIDYGQVYEIIQTRLKDLRDFSSTITQLL